MLKTVTATRYVTPLREGGSLPGLMEADDLGTYVVKYIGAGQGRKTLIAEIVCAGIARGLGLPVPDLVLVEVDPLLGRSEPDEEVQDLLQASAGLNLGMDFLPGSLGFDPLAHQIEPLLASKVLWFDAFVGNVDRSWRNPNLLMWHRALWLIDHGATLVFHHAWARSQSSVAKPYDVSGHVLSEMASARVEADALLRPLVTRALLTEVLADVPDLWLTDEEGFASPTRLREAYVDHLLARLAAREGWRP
ncbi:MAG: aminotransferase class [Frankiales bacterium]|nr:aminotransferase class [Frankiales bacterium]